MLKALEWATLGLGGLMIAGTLLSLSRSPHWLVRVWDFPRVQNAALAALSGVLYGVLFFHGGAWEWAFLGAVVLCVLWQGRKIYPYTPVAPVQVEDARLPVADHPTLRLLISNVLMENREHHRLLELIREEDPDLVLAVETDDAWARALDPLAESHRYVARHPRDNYYGLMLFSRLPLPEVRVEFLVQEDIPSVHVVVELPDGVRVFLHGLHPRPPEPVRDQDSTPRDAELVVMGRAIRDAGDRPTVVAGDLNDVAWSPTTELFMRLSGLLDPRAGRGFFNSYSTRNPLFRYPLDHVFHSHHFRLVELKRLRDVGSDHFPMLVELSCEPGAREEQVRFEREPGDEREAEERLEEQAEAARTGDDRPGRPE
jgi:endonuclease/exonuclease/phosphatase (EEP) superfamily protein YafD